MKTPDLMETARIYDYSDYRAYLVDWVKASPRSRGQFSRIADAARMHRSSLSQVMSGKKEFTLEQAERICAGLGLARPETRFFFLMVNHARAGTARLKEYFQRELEEKRISGNRLVHQVTRTRDLSPEERAIYYSSWVYAAVRNLSAIPRYQSFEAISERLRLDPRTLRPVIVFLLKHGLCLRVGDELRPGPAMTHLEEDSPLVSRHHGNWRVKAMERHPELRISDLAYSAVMSLSEKDAAKIRALIAEVVRKTDVVVGPSPSEKLYCMGIDWFEV